MPWHVSNDLINPFRSYSPIIASASLGSSNKALIKTVYLNAFEAYMRVVLS